VKTSKTYAGIPAEFAQLEKAKIVLIPVPYDGTSTWGKGADKGFEPFLDALENLELFDIETSSEVYKKGVHILPDINEKKSPEAVFNAVYNSTKDLLKSNKFLTFLFYQFNSIFQ